MTSANETDNSTLMTTKNGTASRRKPTIKDVARLAGVSTATVERALKDKDRIRGETRQRVLSAVQELGYQTNDVAKALQNNRIYNVLAVYHTVPEYFTGNFTRGFTAAAENLKSRGLVLTTIRTPSLAPSSAIEVLRNVDFSGVDGMLIDCGGAALDDCIATVSAMGIPVATFGSDSPSSTRRFYVGEDPYISGKLAGEIAGKM
ncbi:MAG: LacI family DNA-binding transcriptional regulator, partial [Eubacteriales bacterium]|nr:LacI family DNA-binding transcriptional regulator [Eubacteriales bacterium]